MMISSLKIGVLFFKRYASQKFGIKAEQIQGEIPWNETFINPSDKVYVWHELHGLVLSTSTEDGFELGHVIDHVYLGDKGIRDDSRTAIPEISHIGVCKKVFVGNSLKQKRVFYIYKFNKQNHKLWVKNNRVSDNDPRNFK